MADGDASAASHQILEHPLVVPDAAAWVQEPQQLADIADQVRAAGAMAYDTEFIGESTYWPMLCLIQIATPDRLVVIDALAEMDLEPVWSLLADPGVVKVVHGGGQDLEPVVRHLDREAVNVFDTQVAAGFCGLPYPLSLARLVQDLLQVRLAKGLTFTSWDERPLSPAHLRYAADDVRYGLALREALEAVLTENGNLERAGAVCAAACAKENFIFDAELQVGRVRGAKSLGARPRAVLLELVALRDQEARERDLPPRTMIRDEVLVDLAKRCPRSEAALKKVVGLPRPLLEGGGELLLKALERGAEAAAQVKVAASVEELPRERYGADALWAMVQAHCRARQIDPALVATRKQLTRLHRTWIGRGQLEDPILAGWRGEFLRPWLSRFLRGEESAAFSWSQQQLAPAERAEINQSSTVEEHDA